MPFSFHLLVHWWLAHDGSGIQYSADQIREIREFINWINIRGKWTSNGQEGRERRFYSCAELV